MAIVSSVSNIPAANYPRMNQLYSGKTLFFNIRRYRDNVWTTAPRPAVIYLHGSGATGHLAAPLLTALIDKGFIVFSIMQLGYPESPAGTYDPFVFGYGNVNAPHFMGHFIRDAYWADAAYEFALSDTSVTGQPIIMLGQSMGATAAVAFASGMSQRASFDSRFRGVVVNAPTAAGLGNGSFNAITRTTSTISQMVEKLKTRAVLMFGDNDLYAPPEYARRIQSAIPEGKDTFVISPGNLGHDWMSTASGAPLAANWAEQLLLGKTILDRLGNPAVAGAAV